MVFIGYVVRKQSNNGKIYVKPQNGFEIEELHNVAISSPANGQVIQYDSTAGLWKNATPSGGGSSDVFTSDFVVNLSGGKTFGKYVSGQTVPASGQTASTVIKWAAIEATNPTATLSATGSIAYGSTGTTIALSGTYGVTTPGSSLTSVNLQYSYDGGLTWNTISSPSTSGTSFTYNHNISYTQYSMATRDYRLVVTDSDSNSSTATASIYATAYVQPSTGTVSVGSTSRELGNVNTSISATLTKNSPLIAMTAYQILRYVDGSGTGTSIATGTITGDPATKLVTYSDTTAPVNSVSIRYAIQFKDSVTSTYTTATNGTSSLINLSYRIYYGPATSVTTIANIQALTPGALSSGRAASITGATATTSQYYYFCYKASVGNLVSVVLNSALNVLGAFQNTSPNAGEPDSPFDITGYNADGASVTYRVYKTTAKGAFTSDNLVFS